MFGIGRIALHMRGLFILSALAGASHALAQESSIVHTVYGAARLPEVGLQVRWVQSSHGWTATNESTYLDSRAGCYSLLEIQQMQALQEMVRRKILSPERALAYVKLGASFAPQRISFFEHGLRGSPEATLWSVSGQDWESGAEVPRLLPWMIEPKWEPLARSLDRTKHRFLFEWGRASKVESGDIDALLDFAAQKAFREVYAYGGRSDEAFIMIHAISPSHTLSYLKRFPGTRFSTNAPRDGDSILMIPLTQILDSHPLARSSRVIRDLKAIVGDPHFTDASAAQLLEIYREFMWLEATWTSAGLSSAHPLIVQDFSPWAQLSLYAKLERYGVVGDRAYRVMQVLVNTPLTKRLQKKFRYVDTVNLPGPSQVAFDENATEISGLDPQQLARDPDYLEKVLFAVTGNRLNQAREVCPGCSADEIWAEMIRRNSPVIIVTRNPAMGRAVARLAPYRIANTGVSEVSAEVPHAFRQALGDDVGEASSLYFFNYRQIRNLARSTPERIALFMRSVSHLERGRHHREFLLASPDLY